MCLLPFASCESLRRKGEVQTAHADLRCGELRARLRGAVSHEQVGACKLNDNDDDSGIGGGAEERFADANLKGVDKKSARGATVKGDRLNVFIACELGTMT